MFEKLGRDGENFENPSVRKKVTKRQRVSACE